MGGNDSNVRERAFEIDNELTSPDTKLRCDCDLRESSQDRDLMWALVTDLGGKREAMNSQCKRDVSKRSCNEIVWN